MRRLLLAGGVIGLLAVVVAVSQSRTAPAGTPAADPNGIAIKVEGKNPWTDLKLNDDPGQFQFAVMSDRTGGHRANVFSKAVYQVNLLQPAFVMSVGDLIEGYTAKAEKLAQEWEEFDAFTRNFRMPFFYTGGNHDLSNKEEAATWEQRYGRKHYHFVYKNALFLVMNSEEGGTRVGPEQQAYVRKALEENAGVRWTFAFIHKPIWTGKDLVRNGWADVEKSLAGRKYTVFCGHVHRYQKYVRNGMNYYQLATTGGGSRLRGVQYGEFDHVAWVTVKADAPVVANVLLDGLLPEDLKLPEVNEPGVPVKRKKTYPVGGVLTLDGKPVAGATVRFTLTNPVTGKTANAADGLTDANGRFQMTAYSKFDGCPAGEYVVVVLKAAAGFDDGEADAGPKSLLPAAYGSPATSPLKVTVKDEANDVKLELTVK